MEYRWLKNYVQSLKQKEYLNGKEIQRLQGATARLEGLEADRRSISLGLTPFIPYEDRPGKYLGHAMPPYRTRLSTDRVGVGRLHKIDVYKED